jgi:hypothetical protein
MNVNNAMMIFKFSNNDYECYILARTLVEAMLVYVANVVSSDDVLKGNPITVSLAETVNDIGECVPETVKGRIFLDSQSEDTFRVYGLYNKLKKSESKVFEVKIHGNVYTVFAHTPEEAQTLVESHWLNMHDGPVPWSNNQLIIEELSYQKLCKRNVYGSADSFNLFTLHLKYPTPCVVGMQKL